MSECDISQGKRKKKRQRVVLWSWGKPLMQAAALASVQKAFTALQGAGPAKRKWVVLGEDPLLD